MKDSRNGERFSRHRNQSVTLGRESSLGHVLKDKEDSYIESTLDPKMLKRNRVWKISKSFILSSAREEFMIGSQDQYTLALFKNSQIKNLMMQRTTKLRSTNRSKLKVHSPKINPIIIIKDNAYDFEIQGKGNRHQRLPPLNKSNTKQLNNNAHSSSMKSRNLSLSTVKILSLLNKNMCVQISQSKVRKRVPLYRDYRDSLLKEKVKLSLLGKDYADKLKNRK
jgi:hypothetical protein